MKQFLPNCAGMSSPSSVSAREELANIFKYSSDELCEQHSDATKQAIKILQKNPQFAAQYFEATDDADVTFRFLPLSIFVTSGASLDNITIVHNLFPKAVSTVHPNIGIYPLQAACEVHADYDVLKFLARKFTDAVHHRDYKGNLIIHSVLSQGKDFIPRRKTVELLLDIYPQSLLETNYDGECPLGIAFRTQQSTKIIEKIMAKRHEQHINHFEINNWKNYTLDAKDVSRLAYELLPKLLLTSFRCEPSSISDVGYTYLMESLQDDHLIQDLILVYPPLTTYEMAESFLNFFRNNKTVRNLKLTRKISMWSLTVGIDTLLQGLALNDTLESLSVSGLFLVSSFEFGFLIAKGPTTLVLEEIMIENNWKNTNIKYWPSSNVRHLTIRNCKMSGKCLDKLLEALRFLPSLTDLTLDFSGPEDKHDAKHLNGRDVTKPLVALLQKNILRSLKIHGLEIQMRHVSCALGTNTSLRVLHVDALRTNLPMQVQMLVAALVEDNKTLEDIKFHCDYKYDLEDKKGGVKHNNGKRAMQSASRFTYVEDPAIKYYTDRNQEYNSKKPKRFQRKTLKSALQNVKTY